MSKFLSLEDITLSYPFDIFVTILLFIFLILLQNKYPKICFFTEHLFKFYFFYIISISGLSTLLFFLSIIGFDYVILRYFFWILILLTF